MRFKPTEAQKKALELIKSGAKHVLIFGGSRSGKTTLLVMVIIFRCLAYPGSRHLICRLKLKDAKSSVLHETLVPWLERTCGRGHFKYYRHENFIKLTNGSEIWIGGLGDRSRWSGSTRPDGGWRTTGRMRWGSEPTTHGFRSSDIRKMRQ